MVTLSCQLYIELVLKAIHVACFICIVNWTVILLTVLVTPARAESSVNIVCGINNTTLCRWCQETDASVFLLPAVREKNLKIVQHFEN
jgi:hypothetical protein